jgi:hypothetical protein
MPRAIATTGIKPVIDRHSASSKPSILTASLQAQHISEKSPSTWTLELMILPLGQNHAAGFGCNPT